MTVTEWKKEIADLVRLAIDKGYYPDEYDEDRDGFNGSFEKIFGEKFKKQIPRHCISFADGLVIHSYDIENAEQVLTRLGYLDHEARVILQEIANKLLGVSIYM